MNYHEKIEEWTLAYLKHVSRIGVDAHVYEEEGYKFIAVNHFQNNFDLDAPDLAGMLDSAILKNSLVVSAQFWPRKMLLLYAAHFPEKTREILTNLFAETTPVYSRISIAHDEFEKLNKLFNKEHPGHNSYIGLRFISLLLGFRFPEKYNPLKPAEWKMYVRFINPDFKIPVHTPAGEQYQMYEKYIEPLREYLKTRKEIKVIKEALAKNLNFKDNEYRWITQDVIYVTARVLAKTYNKDNHEEKISVRENNNESHTIEEDVETEDNTGFVPLEKHLEEYIVKNWDLVDFGEELHLYRDDGDTPAQQYVTDVGIIDILSKDKNGNFVVIELKRAESKYEVVGQILNYMGWVEKNLATNGEKVRGLIIVGKANKTLQSAVSQVGDKIKLKEYRVKMTFQDSVSE